MTKCERLKTYLFEQILILDASDEHEFSSVINCQKFTTCPMKNITKKTHTHIHTQGDNLVNKLAST